jgi:NhaA family Na+:H+ antiporter
VVARILRTETVGGALLLLGAVAALVWANSPWSGGYDAMRSHVPWPGGADLHLDLTLAQWVADGLLAVFFFVVGLELKRELVVGDLRDPARAALPIVAAVGGMVAPALVYLAVASGSDGALRGWAVPTATDIAFALAVLAVIGSHLPSGLRSFLLTLAVVDDLLAITVIALFFTDAVALDALLVALLLVVTFGAVVRRRRAWWLLPPLALAAWGFMHASGVHATVAGVLLGLVVPVRSTTGEPHGRAEQLEHRWRPVSAGIVVPVFALFAAGVGLGGDSIADALGDRAAVAVMLALVVGKCVGVLGSTYLLARFTRAELDDSLSWSDLLGVSLLAGIGFTVSLLINELAFHDDLARAEHVTVAVLAGSLLAGVLAAGVLRSRNATYRRLHELESLDADGNAVPDVYEG